MGAIGQLGDILARMLTVAKDIQRCETDIKEARQDVKKISDILVDHKNAINRITAIEQEVCDLKRTVGKIDNLLETIKVNYEQDRKLLLTQIELLFSKLENGLNDKENDLNNKISAEFARLEIRLKDEIAFRLTDQNATQSNNQRDQVISADGPGRLLASKNHPKESSGE